jgi:hypothetical protein
MVIIGRAINGISLNGLEYILEEEGGDILKFYSEEQAKLFLLAKGEVEENLYLYTFQNEGDPL